MADKIVIDPKTRILVVDDQPFIRNIVKAILKGFGLNETITAEDGSRAIDLLNDSPFDLIICDWNMPHVAGIEVLRHIRSSAHSNRTPFIMLTAEAYRENLVEALEAGVTDYISKPFTPDTLGEKVSSALKRTAKPK